MRPAPASRRRSPGPSTVDSDTGHELAPGEVLKTGRHTFEAVIPPPWK